MDPITQVYKYLDEQNQKEVAEFRKPSPRFRLSELDNCPRKIYYRHEGFQPMPLPGFVSLYGQDGDIAHDSVRWLMRNAGVELDGLEFNEETGEIKELMEFKKSVEHKGEQFVVSGRADGAIKVNGEWMLLEVKSVDGFKYKYLNESYNKGDILDYLENGNKGKYRRYLAQCEVGMRMLGYERTYLVLKDRSLCQIGMWDRNNDVREGIILERNDEIWNYYMDTMAMVAKARRTQEPPLQLLEGSYECETCEFRKVCRGVE